MYKKIYLAVILTLATTLPASAYKKVIPSIKECTRILNKAEQTTNYTEKIGFTKWLLLNAPNAFLKKGRWFKRNYTKVKNLILASGKMLTPERDDYLDKKKFKTAYALSEMFAELICLAMENKLLRHPKNYKTAFLNLIKKDIALYGKYAVAESGKEYDYSRTIESNIMKQLRYINKKTNLRWKDTVSNMMSEAKQEQL